MSAGGRYAEAPRAGRRAGRALRRSRSSRPPASVFLMMILPTRVAMLADERLHLGLDIWLKPLKFQVALAIFCLHAWRSMPAGCPTGTTGRRWHRVYVASVVAAMGAEIVWISGAAALGTTSHFNTTPVGMALYAAAGVLAVWFTGATLVYGVLIARNRRPGFDPALRCGAGAGADPDLRAVGGLRRLHEQLGQPLRRARPRATRAGWRLMGWSREVGDLRVAHFFGTHAMHAVPLAGFVAGRVLARAAGGRGDLGLRGALGGVLRRDLRAGAGGAAVPGRVRGLGSPPLRPGCCHGPTVACDA